MRIFLLGVNCTLITSLAPLRNAKHFPVCFRLIVYRDRVARPISDAPAMRSCDDTDNYRVAMHSYASPHRNGVCRASRADLFTMYDVLQSICLSMTLRLTVASKLCDRMIYDRSVV